MEEMKYKDQVDLQGDALFEENKIPLSCVGPVSPRNEDQKYTAYFYLKM